MSEPRRSSPGAEGGSSGACRRLSRHGALLLALFFAAPATAEEGGGEAQTIAVLDLGAPPVLRNLARALAAAIAEEAEALGHRTLDSRDVAAAVGQERVDDAAECGLDTACILGALGDGLPAGRILFGTLDRGRTAYEVRLVYVDVATRGVVGRLNRDILIASRRLERDVREAVPGVLAGVPEQSGFLVVATDVPGARVVVNRELAGETPPHVRVELQPGRHHLQIVAPNHLPYDRYVEVAAGEETLLEPRLFLEPGKEPPSLVAEVPEEEEPGRGLQAPPATLVSLGVGVVALGGGAWLGQQARQIERAAVDTSGHGILGVTRAEALAGKRHARNANILYGVAGAALITASVFAIVPFGEGLATEPEGTVVGLQLGGGTATLSIGGRLP